MSASPKAGPTRRAAPAAGTRLPRTCGFARRMQGRLLSDLRLRERWDDPLVVPEAARPVLEAAVRLVASADDAFEYRPDPERDSKRSLAGRLAWLLHIRAAEEAARAERRAARARRFGEDAEREARAGLQGGFAAPDEAEVERHLARLAHVELLVSLDGGGLRLGVDCRPRVHKPKAEVSALKSQTARKNGAKNKSKKPAPPGQTEALSPLPGGRGHAAETVQAAGFAGPTAPPKGAPKLPPSEAAAGSGAGSAMGPGVCAGPRAPGLSSLSCLAAAAESEESINSSTCTAAAAKGTGPSLALDPRAGAGAGVVGCGTEPTEGPSNPPTGTAQTAGSAGPKTAPDGTPAGTPLDVAAVHVLAMKVGEAIQCDGRRGIPGPVAVAEWLTAGVPPDTMLAVSRNRGDAHQKKVRLGLAEPIGSFEYLMDAMYGAIGRVRPGKEQLPLSAPVPAASPLSPEEVAKRQAARKRRDLLGESSKAALQQALDACRGGDEAALREQIARLYNWHQRALEVLIDEEPRARALYEQMRRAG